MRLCHGCQVSKSIRLDTEFTGDRHWICPISIKFQAGSLSKTCVRNFHGWEASTLQRVVSRSHPSQICLETLPYPAQGHLHHAHMLPEHMRQINLLSLDAEAHDHAPEPLRRRASSRSAAVRASFERAGLPSMGSSHSKYSAGSTKQPMTSAAALMASPAPPALPSACGRTPNKPMQIYKCGNRSEQHNEPCRIGPARLFSSTQMYNKEVLPRFNGYMLPYLSSVDEFNRRQALLSVPHAACCDSNVIMLPWWRPVGLYSSLVLCWSLVLMASLPERTHANFRNPSKVEWYAISLARLGTKTMHYCVCVGIRV